MGFDKLPIITSMYIPPHFAESRLEELHRIVQENPLGILVTRDESGCDANHLPFWFDAQQGPHGVLIAHVARSNPLWREVKNGDEVLVIFRGVEGYISPNWYPGKQDTHRRVPTWNYEVVHAHGSVHVHDDEKFTRGVVARLTREHEATQPQPWKMGDAPADYMDEQLRHIVGIEVRIEKLVGKRKLSQNHAPQDREGAMAGLNASGHPDLARAMRKA